MDNNVTELNKRVEREMGETVSLYNPTSKDFELKRPEGDFIALALDTMEVPKHLLGIIEKKLVEHVLNVRGLSHKQSNRDTVSREVEMNDA